MMFGAGLIWYLPESWLWTVLRSGAGPSSSSGGVKCVVEIRQTRLRSGLWSRTVPRTCRFAATGKLRRPQDDRWAN